ncbi:flagellar hook-associated protein 3 [Stenotrophobium rhamnosiphilum]|uniref:Flagellar hook-associated protein 3 n=2 Tax=Stenotrophobium rhamnosiphilum TaxID=2029166 RepID=A0A2T5MDF7_9GAMM|nr:flagellar hook-associated protein 3 [Stenotrophobium rhamnosiphilum]
MIEQSVRSMNAQQNNLAKIQSQISSQQRMQTAADDPAGWARGMSLDQVLAGITTYGSNINTAQQRLGLEENALADSGNILQSVSALAIQATNGSQSPQSLQAITAQLQQYYNQLLSDANAQDGEGHYLFAGSSSISAPFTQTGNSVTYNGDTSSRLLQIGPQRTIADGDNGASVYMNNSSGNGTFATAVSTTNTGVAQLTNSQVKDASLWDGGTYNVAFTGGNYSVTDSSNNVIASGAYTDGGTVSFRGVQLTFSGAAATGDSFTVSPSAPKDVFASLRDLISLTQNPPTSSAGRAQWQTQMQNLQSEISRSFDAVTNTRSDVGARMASLDDASNRLQDQSVAMKSLLSNVRDLDLAQASTELNLTTVSLQALQLAYTKVQSLSLFQYLR